MGRRLLVLVLQIGGGAPKERTKVEMPVLYGAPFEEDTVQAQTRAAPRNLEGSPL